MDEGFPCATPPVPAKGFAMGLPGVAGETQVNGIHVWPVRAVGIILDVVFGARVW
jgi:hypothetical protein